MIKSVTNFSKDHSSSESGGVYIYSLKQSSNTSVRVPESSNNLNATILYVF